jgi:Brp/Blh family beta-carotene 15,15'-monooxygenase
MDFKKIISPRAFALLFTGPPLLFPEITDNYTLWIFWTGLLLVGIPHGALDHHLQLKADAMHWNKLLPFVAKYVAWMLVFLLIWLISADVAILFFIGISAWHFGSVDFGHPGGVAKRVVAWLWGAGLLAVILLQHGAEVLPILLQLGISDGLRNVFRNEQLVMPLMGILGLLVLISGRPKLWWTFLLLLASAFLPLLLAFGLYFSLQHALESALETKTSLNTTWKKMFRMAAPFSLAAYAIGLIIFFVLLQLELSLTDWMPFAFLFLGMVTLPHVIYYHPERET